MVQAHAWWRLKGLAVDLVIWNEERDVYRQRLQEQILGLIAARHRSARGRPPGRHLRAPCRADRRRGSHPAAGGGARRHQRPPRDACRAGGAKPSTGVGVERPEPARIAPLKSATPARLPVDPSATELLQRHRRLLARRTRVRDRTVGGSSPAGALGQRDRQSALRHRRVRERQRLHLVRERARAAPHAVAQRPGDRRQRRVDLPARRGDRRSLDADASPSAAADSTRAKRPPYRTRHGFGYSVFEHDDAGIHSELTVFVAIDAAVKFSRLVLRNDSGRPRRLSATGYVEWVLGDLRAKTAPHIQHRGRARQRRAVRAQPATATTSATGSPSSTSTIVPDRRRQLHRRPHRVHRPQRLAARARLRCARSGCPAAPAPALDPCAAIQVPVELAPGQSREIVFRLGMGRSADEAGQLVQRFRGSAAARDGARRGARALARRAGRGAGEHARPGARTCSPTAGWSTRRSPAACGRAAATTSRAAPTAFATSCRTRWRWCTRDPRLLREQLLLCASRQFREGDVQHWWHPPSGRGVRTRISDDYLWLPLALCRYVRATRRHRRARRGRALPRRAAGAAAATSRTTTCRAARRESASLYEHARARGAARPALRRARPAADGHRRLERRHEPVGHDGRGESVWLGFFLCEVLRAVRRRWRGAAATTAFAAALRRRTRSNSRGASKRTAGTASWYRRAYFDDGTPLGSAGQRRMPDRLDRAELGRAVGRRRDASACDARWTRWPRSLVRRDAGLVQLLDPPFDRAGPQPRLHRRLRAGRARERRPVHPRRGVGGDGLRRAGRRSARLAADGPHQPAAPRPHAEPRWRSTRSSPTWWRPMSTAWRRTPAAAAGAGTPARPAGCTG